ncbi:hypothetical protein B0H14DRAFT_2572873 [Mycena olivaceomarginata]|nr:hypothetical protein B0H14DRAFT_2572873 [Mycena olivaceomarginata]
MNLDVADPLSSSSKSRWGNRSALPKWFYPAASLKWPYSCAIFLTSWWRMVAEDSRFRTKEDIMMDDRVVARHETFMGEDDNVPVSKEDLVKFEESITLVRSRLRSRARTRDSFRNLASYVEFMYPLLGGMSTASAVQFGLWGDFYWIEGWQPSSYALSPFLGSGGLTETSSLGVAMGQSNTSWDLNHIYFHIMALVIFTLKPLTNAIQAVIRSWSRQTLPWFWLGVESFFPVRFPCRRPVSSSVLATLASDESLSGVEWDDKQRAPRGGTFGLPGHARRWWRSTAVLMAGHSHRITDPLSKPRNPKSEKPISYFSTFVPGKL